MYLMTLKTGFPESISMCPKSLVMPGSCVFPWANPSLYLTEWFWFEYPRSRAWARDSVASDWLESTLRKSSISRWGKQNRTREETRQRWWSSCRLTWSLGERWSLNCSAELSLPTSLVRQVICFLCLLIFRSRIGIGVCKLPFPAEGNSLKKSAAIRNTHLNWRMASKGNLTGVPTVSTTII